MTGVTQGNLLLPFPPNSFDVHQQPEDLIYCEIRLIREINSQAVAHKSWMV